MSFSAFKKFTTKFASRSHGTDPFLSAFAVAKVIRDAHPVARGKLGKVAAFSASSNA
jgi:hypothetical protein